VNLIWNLYGDFSFFSDIPAISASHPFGGSMKFHTLAAMAVLGTCLGTASALAGTPHPVREVIAPGQVPDLVQVASKTSERNRKKRRNFNSGFSYRELGIIPGHVPTPYGYRDCIGSWHLHANGHIHCHGQLIREF
jgi:hypothetical protein